MFEFQTSGNGQELIAITKVIKKQGDVTIGRVQSTFNILETGIALENSQTSVSLIKWDWEKMLERTKRFHLDHFAILIPIEDFYPRNYETDTSDLYLNI